MDHRKHLAGKGDCPRRVDQKKWDEGWALAFPQWRKDMDKREYVVCYVLDPEKQSVVLIHKQRGPAAVIGQWNGLGGKIEVGETQEQTASREVQEESGLRIQTTDWEHLGTLKGPSYTLHFLWAISPDMHEAFTNETEPVAFVNINTLPEPIMNNVKWMLPLICDDDVIGFGTLEMTRG